jgi:hypothetical protein
MFAIEFEMIFYVTLRSFEIFFMVRAAEYMASSLVSLTCTFRTLISCECLVASNITCEAWNYNRKSNDDCSRFEN